MLCSNCYKEISVNKEVYKKYSYPLRDSTQAGYFCKKCAVKVNKHVRRAWFIISLVILLVVLVSLAVVVKKNFFHN